MSLGVVNVCLLLVHRSVSRRIRAGMKGGGDVSGVFDGNGGYDRGRWVMPCIAGGVCVECEDRMIVDRRCLQLRRVAVPRMRVLVGYVLRWEVGY